LVWDKLARRYGQVFSIKFGTIEAVVVSGYDAVREVLCKDDFYGQSDGFFFRTRAFYKRLGRCVYQMQIFKHLSMIYEILK